MIVKNCNLSLCHDWAYAKSGLGFAGGESARGSSGVAVAMCNGGLGHNYSSSTSLHHQWQRPSSMAALSTHINSLELKVIDFSFLFFWGEVGGWGFGSGQRKKELLF